MSSVDRRGTTDNPVVGLLSKCSPSSRRRRTILDLNSNNRQRPTIRSHQYYYLLLFVIGMIIVILAFVSDVELHQYSIVDDPIVVGIAQSTTLRQTAPNDTSSIAIATTNKNTKANNNDIKNNTAVINNNPKGNKGKKLKLRYDWTNLQPTMELTKKYVAHQSNCSLPLGDFVYRDEYGFGSDLHWWGRGLCNGLGTNRRIRTLTMNWTWYDQESCDIVSDQSPMLCYFPKSELQCPTDAKYVRGHPTFDADRALSRSNGNIRNLCKYTTDGKYTTTDQRIAGLEFLFLNLSPIVVQEAERQLNLIFGEVGEIPKDLITVHIRWGDKKVEMRLVRIPEYIQAVHKILAQRGVTNHSQANIFLATEDPEAVQRFQEKMPSTWNLYLDQYYVDMLPYRIKGYNGNPLMSQQLKGKAGLVTLASLVVAMESNDFVLTTASNWSRMINELRLAIIEPRCAIESRGSDSGMECTFMVDLRRPMRGQE